MYEANRTFWILTWRLFEQFKLSASRSNQTRFPKNFRIQLSKEGVDALSDVIKKIKPLLLPPPNPLNKSIELPARNAK